MKKLFGEALRASILDTKAHLINVLENRQRRIDNCETDMDDCFVSERIERNGLVECDKQLKILDTDGLMDYDAVFDNDGNEVWVHWVNICHGTGLCGAFNSTIEVVRWHTNMVTGEYVGYPG